MVCASPRLRRRTLPMHLRRRSLCRARIRELAAVDRDVEAAKALLQALETNSADELKAIFGPGTNIPEAARDILRLIRETRTA